MMNFTFSIKLPVLFVLSIVLPALALAYLGIRAIESEREQAMGDQARLARLLRGQFDRMIQRSLDDLGRAVRRVSTGGYDFGDRSNSLIRTPFLLDAHGAWVVPAVPPERTIRLSPTFREALTEAERLEFAARDFPQALSAYQELIEQSTDSTEQAIALNALARCALQQGDQGRALEAYTALLRDYPSAFDQNGVHLSTYAYLGKADLLFRTGRPLQALNAFNDMVHAIAWGVHPVYEGCTYYLRRVEEMIHPFLSPEPDKGVPPDVRAAADSLRSRLQQVEEQVHFIERYGPLLSRLDVADLRSALNAGPDSVLYLTGQTPDGPYLIALTSWSEGLFLGAPFDLNAIQTELGRSPVGQEIGQRGFSLSILSDPAVPGFRQIYGDVLTTITVLSDRFEGFQLGLYAEDPTHLLRTYRQRRGLLFVLIVLLTATIGFGGYLVLRDAAREAKLSRLRSDFVSNVSHELKTPLTSIRLYAETLLMSRVRNDTERTAYTETILHESERLARLVDNVLDFSKIERGRKAYHLQDEDLADIARSCLDLFQDRLREEGFTVHTDLPPAVRPIPLDRDSVTQAILNLLSNAVKYSTDRKEVTLPKSPCLLYTWVFRESLTKERGKR